MRSLFAPVVLAAALALSGCAPLITAAGSTPSGQAALQRAVDSAFARAGFAPAAAPSAPLPAAAEARVTAGPMLADVTHRGAAIWVQTDGPAPIRIAYAPQPAPGDARPNVHFDTTAAVHTAPDGTATVRVYGLEPGTAYTYAVLVGGRQEGFAYATGFTTQPLWQWRTDPPTVTVALGSCYYDNSEGYDRPGGPYGGSTAIFESIRKAAPDAMLWLGDNTYLREVDWWSADGIADRYRHARAEPGLQPLLAATAHYATWDDHDYGPNDSDRSYTFKGAALETFQRFWPNPTYGLPGVPGVFTQFQWGDAEFFLLDNRYHRSPNTTPADAERTILGAEQKQWLLDALTFSRAPFKMVGIGGQVLNPWQGFETYANIAPEERDELLREIEARGIEGVVFLSGDRHHTELNRMDRPGAYPLYEFTSSPLTAGSSPTPRDVDLNPIRIDGTLVAGQRSFGTLTFSGPRQDRTLTMRAHSAEGALLWEHAVRANDLRMPR
jgi:alkaline phosphatase D